MKPTLKLLFYPRLLLLLSFLHHLPQASNFPHLHHSTYPLLLSHQLILPMKKLLKHQAGITERSRYIIQQPLHEMRCSGWRCTARSLLPFCLYHLTEDAGFPELRDETRICPHLLLRTVRSGFSKGNIRKVTGHAVRTKSTSTAPAPLLTPLIPQVQRHKIRDSLQIGWHVSMLHA